jgi:hypothetical protein
VINRVSWAAVAALAFVILALTSAALEQDVFAATFALCSITWAILSLKEKT